MTVKQFFIKAGFNLMESLNLNTFSNKIGKLMKLKGSETSRMFIELDTR